MDVSSAKEFDRMEALRRMEISRGLRLATRDRMRAVRREKMRWAVSFLQGAVVSIMCILLLLLRLQRKPFQRCL